LILILSSHSGGKQASLNTSLRKLFYILTSSFLRLSFPTITFIRRVPVQPPLISLLPFPGLPPLHLAPTPNASSLPFPSSSLLQCAPSSYFILLFPDYSCLSLMQEVINSRCVVVVLEHNVLLSIKAPVIHNTKVVGQLP